MRKDRGKYPVGGKNVKEKVQQVARPRVSKSYLCPKKKNLYTHTHTHISPANHTN